MWRLARYETWIGQSRSGTGGLSTGKARILATESGCRSARIRGNTDGLSAAAGPGAISLLLPARATPGNLYNQ